MQDLYKDPLCRCSAVNINGCDPDWNGEMMIATRADLTPADGKYPEFTGHENMGAIDAKITNYEYIQKMMMRAISSPPFELLPAFNWTTTYDLHVLHTGLPDKWEFPWFDIEYT